MEPVISSPEEFEEAYLLLQDAAESAVLDAQTMKMKPAVDGRYKIFSFVALGYLMLNLVSRRVPGPAHWVGLAQHVQLFHRIASLFSG